MVWLGTITQWVPCKIPAPGHENPTGMEIRKTLDTNGRQTSVPPPLEGHGLDNA